jgi:TfoX/Sxy family transcriptional regulator of competence genes
MASDASFADYVVDQLGEAGRITRRKMFGEYAIYCNDLVVALVCDNQLFVKPTEAGRAYAGDLATAPPYPGAKLYLLIENQLEDRAWMAGLIRATVQDLVKGQGETEGQTTHPPVRAEGEKEMKSRPAHRNLLRRHLRALPQGHGLLPRARPGLSRLRSPLGCAGRHLCGFRA